MSEVKCIKPEFLYNISDTSSKWKCDCGFIFITTHKAGIIDETDVFYCSRCGVKFDWSE